MSSTARCRQLGLILGLSGTAGTVTAQAASSTARPGGGNTEPPAFVCDAIYSQWNRLYFAQAVFSSLSIVMCLAVIAVLCKRILCCPRALPRPAVFRMHVGTGRGVAGRQ